MLISLRNEFVHTGKMDLTISEKRIKIIMKDFEVAVDRIYNHFGKCFNLILSNDY